VHQDRDDTLNSAEWRVPSAERSEMDCRHSTPDSALKFQKPMPFRRSYFVTVAILLAGCSSAEPVLYPNAHLQSVGNETAKQDIETCREFAEQAGADEGTGQGGRVARNTAVGAGAGAASGAVGGAISGGAGIGSAIGAASGAVWGLISSLFTLGSSAPSQAHVNVVTRCLQERGYEVAGWQ